jgi:hypothetical protein
MMMNGWAYRFCSQTNEDGIVEWSVRTVYYGADGNIVSNGSMPVEPYGETRTELLRDIQLMLEASMCEDVDLDSLETTS